MKTSYIYNKGKQELPLIPLYTNSGGVRTQNTDHLLLSFNDIKTDWHFSCCFGTQSKINVTNIDKIYVHYSNITLTGDTTTLVCLSNNRGEYIPTSVKSYHQEFLSGNDIKIEYDVSTITEGSYFLDFGIASHPDNIHPVTDPLNNYRGTGNATIDSIYYQYKE